MVSAWMSLYEYAYVSENELALQWAALHCRQVVKKPIIHMYKISCKFAIPLSRCEQYKLSICHVCLFHWHNFGVSEGWAWPPFLATCIKWLINGTCGTRNCTSNSSKVNYRYVGLHMCRTSSFLPLSILQIVAFAAWNQTHEFMPWSNNHSWGRKVLTWASQ